MTNIPIPVASRRDSVVSACSIDEAAYLIAEEGFAPLAGGTWLMRSRLRGEDEPPRLVDLSRLADLTGVACGHDGLRIGAMATHSSLAAALPPLPVYRGLLIAAMKSANPNIRNTATVGGNVATIGFRAPDVATALLGLRATVEYIVGSAPNERTTSRLDDFMAYPPTRPHLITSITVPVAVGVGTHVRLPLRAAGDYPVAIVSAVTTDSEGDQSNITVAYGAVGARPTRWYELEQCLGANPTSPEEAYEHAKRLGEQIAVTASVGVPAAYRRAVLPTMVRRALHKLEEAKLGEPE
ncbi:FAD binding domain-containing protein [Rhodococcus sp. IEGM 1366]|uniref:FAD binding domain-containing protein n=1 Tax=Rhodococcus sp. IEGM 1366 TaxID=3082223 RepID=UPI002954A317|nr:FAD binding domain-containing protein [Rhodococcus sp. IEGM 1366]MDV8070746.1 FAD binding domain-containing protein [Rhodococcus sp. IEGM 1366]